jgi:hypothetical protein
VSYKADKQQQKIMRKNCPHCVGYNFWSNLWRHDFTCPVYKRAPHIPVNFIPLTEQQVKDLLEIEGWGKLPENLEVTA